MDYLRSCYRSQMAIYSDRPDVLVWGRWHFCKPGALPVPYLHAFGSSIWDEPTHIYTAPFGEVDAKGGYFKGGTNPRLKGQKVCGNAAVWEHGALYARRGTLPTDSEGVPDCCDKRKQQRGGAAGGLRASFWYDYTLTAAGGLELDGEGQFGEGFTAAGGILLDGVGRFGTAWHGSGGLDLDGVGRFGSGWTGSGGLDLDGEGAFGSGWSGSGGLDLDGEGQFGVGWTGSGGLLLGGEGRFGTAWPASGGLLLDGVGQFGFGFLAGGGGILLDGEGGFGGGFVTGGGGLLLDGEGEFPLEEDVIGMIVMWGGAGALPTGWLECDGSDVATAAYPTLSGILGTTWGSPGGGNFRLPKFNARSPVGVGALSPFTTKNLADSGGEQDHTLTTAEMPAHTHPQAATTWINGGTFAIQAGLMVFNQAVGGTTQSTGGGGTHNNMHPYLGVRFIIKAL